MGSLSKRRKELQKLVDKTKLYDLKEAVTILKNGPKTKFDQTVEVVMKLKLEQTSNPVRGTVSLPNGTGKKTRIAVFCKGDFEKAAKEAGADFVGSDDLIKKVLASLHLGVRIITPQPFRSENRAGSR